MTDVYFLIDLETGSQGPSTTGFWGEPSSWLAALALCTHMAERERESKLSGISSHHEGLTLMTPI